MQISRGNVVPINHKFNPIDKEKIVTDKSVIVKLAAQILTKQLEELISKLPEVTEKYVCDHAQELGADNVVNLKVSSEMGEKLIPSYLSLVEKKLVDFKLPSRINDMSEGFADGEIGLELIDNEAVEEQILIEGIITRSESKYYEMLYALNKRLAIALKVTVLENNINPIAPAVLMASYVEILQKQNFSTEVRIANYYSFEAAVLLCLEEVYKAINKLCIDEGILPKLPKHKVLKEGTSGDVVRSPADDPDEKSTVKNREIGSDSSGDKQPSVINELPAELYSSLLEMAKVQRIRSAGSEEAEKFVVTGDQIPTDQLLGSLTGLQKTSVTEDGFDSVTLREKIAESIQVNGERQPYTENDEVLIDVVAMFFDVILQDRHLPDAVRVMLAQLQIPILKVVMIDKDFFAKKSHPARRFLNDLSKAGLGISEQSKQFKNHVLDKMDALVERVLMEFERDIELFSELCDEFSIFMEQQQRQVDVIEERARKVTQSSEKLELARRQAAYEITLRMQGESFPAFIRVFLEDAWKDVLVLALLRQERDSEALTGCLNIVDNLMMSVIPQEEVEKRQAIIKSLPRLIKDLKVGLEDISYDFHEALPWFKDLEAWHRQVLLTSGEAKEELEQNDVLMVEIDEEPLDLEDDLLMELEKELSEMPKDKYTKKVNKIAVGDWVEYSNEGDSALLRAKLSWKSTVTLKCLFVNEMGVKALDLSLSDLAELLRQKKMVIVEPEKAPLVERVFASMKSFIGDLGAEPVPAG